jgi:large conductance mechanosensitive channel
MSFISEFKKFALRGNVVDMAVGIIIGGAFGTIVNSLVKDVIMPPIGYLLGGVDFSDLAITLKHAVGDTPAVVIKYGVFINALIGFLIVAFAVFLLVKVINKLESLRKTDKTVAAAALTPEQQLLTEIRDLLKKSHNS